MSSASGRACGLLCACWLAALVGCSGRGQFVGRWESEHAPRRTLDLFDDGSYSLRLSKGRLGFISDLLGPQRGAWRVEGGVLVLTQDEDAGQETIHRWPVNEIHRDELVLVGERWRRVSPGAERSPRRGKEE